MLIVQVLINGLLLGGLYGIMALGMSLIWGVMNIVNIAHGAMIMLGAYLTFWMFTLWGWDPFLSLPATIVLLFAYGYCLQRFLLNLIVRAQLFLTLLITFGVEVVMVNLVRIAWSSDLRQVTPTYAGANFAVGGVTVPYVRLWVFLTTVILSVAFLLILEKTRLGRAIRATSEELRAARLTGIPVAHIYAVTFGLGAALAGAAGGASKNPKKLALTLAFMSGAIVLAVGSLRLRQAPLRRDDRNHPLLALRRHHFDRVHRRCVRAARAPRRAAGLVASSV